ncbi:hypothetical protein [Streptomyces ambofaciens]|nr:hypothetical protein [Streptomyces ambofaciens]
MVRWPGVAREVGAALLERADALCPYARTADKGTPTTLTLVS